MAIPPYDMLPVAGVAYITSDFVQVELEYTYGHDVVLTVGFDPILYVASRIVNVE